MSMTPIIKDATLEFLCANYQPEKHHRIDHADIESFLEKLNITFNDLQSILTYFQRLGFVNDLNCRHTCIFFTLLIEANDFQRTGGFAFRELLLQRQLEQLVLEIDVLKKQLGPNHLEKAEKISSIAGALLAGIGLFRQ